MATKINLQKKGVVFLSLSCPLCGDVDETENHIFVQCSMSRRILSHISRWWGVDCNQVLDISQLFMWGESLNFKGEKLKVFLAVVYAYLFLIWKLRNEKIFSSANRQNELLASSQLLFLAQE